MSRFAGRRTWLRQSPPPTSAPPVRRRVAAVGADDHGKQELDPRLVARSILVVDELSQCAELGELQHAITAGLMTASTAEEITIFDSTGTALQDLAAAIAVEARARAAGTGQVVDLGA